MEKKTGKILALLLSVAILFGACKKEAEPGSVDQKALDQESIEVYAKANNLNGQFTSTGLYYVIITEGDENHPDEESIVTVTYDGYYLDGSHLDKGEFFQSRLSRLIPGWIEGISLIGVGGQIKLIIPEHLGYENGVLVFDVTLHYFS